MQTQRFVKEGDGFRLISPAADLVAFLSGPLAESASGYRAAIDAFRSRYGSALHWWRGTNMKRMRKADTRLWETVEAAFGDQLDEEDIELLVCSGPTSRDAITPAFEATYYAEPDACGLIRLTLPVTDNDAKNGATLMELASAAFADVQLTWGYGGYSLYWNPVDVEIADEAPDIVGPWLLRHPGFAYGDPGDHVFHASKGLIDVNWLTFLGPALAAKLGGQQVLSKNAPSGVRVGMIGHDKVMLQAGDVPATGDVNRKDLLPLYAAVGHLVTGARPPREILDEVTVLGVGEDRRELWLDRFFS